MYYVHVVVLEITTTAAQRFVAASQIVVIPPSIIERSFDQRKKQSLEVEQQSHAAI
jgi:hypothetical protein